MLRVLCMLLAAVAFVVAAATVASAQQAVTVSGHVTAAGMPLAGAHVRLTALKIDRVTDTDGRYSFVVTSANVRGQTVRITATMDDRRAGYLPGSAVVTLTGGELVQDFELAAAGPPQPVPLSADMSGPELPGAAGRAQSLDTLDLAALQGALDLPSALAGAFPGLAVSSSSALGGSESLVFRGPQSLVGSAQPVFIVDGVPVNNTVFTSSAQRYGQGGFDYGSPLQDLDIANIASVRWVTGAEAAALAGGRGANGVVVVTTKNGSTGPGFAISASQRVTSERFLRLPAYQNKFGQGLNGKFEFFDGRGGGINDNVDQSWGPPLDGRPLAQASLTEAGRADVRYWLPHPNNVPSYFDAGRTTNTAAAVQGAGTLGSFRVFGSDRNTRGLSPNSVLSRREAGIHFYARPAPRFLFSTSATVAEMKHADAPGTGYNEGNPVSQFTRMGRQVDTDALRAHRRDASGKQISWSYSGHNNPYFASLENSNRSLRSHGFGSATAGYEFAPWLSATAGSGVDYFRDGRSFAIKSGWMGGYPFFAAPGDFSKGGSEADDIAVQETSSSFHLDAARKLSGTTRWTTGFGADVRSTRERIRSAGIDSAADLATAGAPVTATIPLPVTWNAHSRTNAAFGQSGITFGDAGAIGVSLRNEWTSIVPGQHVSTLYPSVRGAIELVHPHAAARTPHLLSSATLRGAWYRSGSDLTSYAIQTMFAGRALSGSIAPTGAGVLALDSRLAPEITTAVEVGTDLAFFSHRVGLGATYYRATTAGVILPVPDGLSSLVARNAGRVSNNGVETWLNARIGDVTTGFGWDVSANAAKNDNTVEALYGGVKAVALGPSQWGLRVEALQGAPLGALVGQKFLRDPATHALILRAGLPVPDSIAGGQQLGSSQPTWSVGLRNTFHYRWLALSVLGDGRMGGSIFSATKLWGSYAGNLIETAFRPDSGLLIAGVDAATKKANATHVSTQNYYHALAAIQEPWVYDATYFKLRETRLSLTVPTTFWRFPFESATVSLVGRNLYTWFKTAGIDPETLLSPYQFGGLELGQLPASRSLGIEVAFAP